MNAKTDTKAEPAEAAAKPVDTKPATLPAEVEKPTQPRKTDKTSREKWKRERAAALGDLPVEKR